VNSISFTCSRVTKSDFALAGAMVSIYGMDREKLECEEMYCHYRNPEKFLQLMSMSDANFWVDAGALAGIFIGLRIIAYFVLRWRLHSIR
jgi:ATP-binding cassette, subfamily G (WHITE), member 1